jgi:hemoglobin
MTEGESFYHKTGGEGFFDELTTNFYRGVLEDEILRPMYPPGDLTHAQEKLKLFLMQYWGGPDDYSRERGHPRLRMRHSPFAIDSLARDAWLANMRSALEATSIEQELKDEMWSYFTMAADAMVNTTTQSG